MFEMTERGTDAVRSVTLLYERPGEASPLRRFDDAFGQPRHTDVPTPHSAFIKEKYRTDQCFYHSPISTTESSVAELYVFENVKSVKKLELFVWTIEEVEDAAQTNLHYAFLIKVAGI